jgi:hypothetical protein
MTEQTQAASGTVAEEAARLIEAMASMARSSTGLKDDSSSYAGGPDRESGAADAPDGSQDQKEASDGVCSSCGGHRDSTPVACKLCPLCQGIAFMRSVRPETVDRLADLASAVASTLRDLATQSRASGPTPSTAGAASEKASGAGRSTVQDIHVDDEDEG